MSLDFQVKTLEDAQMAYTVVISENIPCIESSEYYLATTTSAGKTFTGTFNSTDYTNYVVLILNGIERGRCYTISSSTTTVITVTEDYEGTANPRIAIVHSAKTMYDYCVSEGKDCIAVTCGSLGIADGSPERPKSYADHTTLKIGTGKYKQSAALTECSVWFKDPRKRAWKYNQIRDLLYKWHKISNTNPVYLIITIEFFNSTTQEVWRQNIDFFYKYSLDSTVHGRGYLKGYPMGQKGTYVYGPKFSMSFEEAWTL